MKHAHGTHDAGAKGHAHDDHRSGDAGQAAIDPVCGMEVERKPDALKAEHAGQDYYFCGERCREKFVRDPSAYVETHAKPQAAEAVPGVKWTCPMHPEIVRDEPGHCPICGMALEPMTRRLSGSQIPN